MKVELKEDIIILKETWFKDFIFRLLFYGLISILPSIFYKSLSVFIVTYLFLILGALLEFIISQLFTYSKVEVNNILKSILLTKSFLGIQIQSKTYLNFNVELLGFSNDGKLNNNVLIYDTLKLIKLDFKNKNLILSQIDKWKTGL